MQHQRSNSLLVPLIKASAIHLLTFGLLLTSFHTVKTEQSLDIQVKKAPVINATAVSSEVVEKLVKQKEQRIAAVAKAERDRKNRIRKKAEREAARKKKAERDRKRKLAEAEQKKREADDQRRRDVIAEKKRKEDAEKKRKADAETKRIAEEKRLAQQQLENEMQAQMDAELNAVNEQRILTELQKYVALIKNKISRNWIVANQSGQCILEVRLAVGGFVIDVKEMGGSPTICRSAMAAVYKADPLPVSNDTEVFRKMRTLRLTLDPQEM
jgi:colicin import membrane protein